MESTAPDELVVNGSAADGVTGWTARSAAGPLRLATTSAGGRPAIRVSRSGSGSGAWAFALAKLRSPVTGFEPGRTYRMQAWVRDPGGSGALIGLLLANGGYAHRPTPVNVYSSRTDTGWHLLSRTFVAAQAGRTDTGLYFDLPDSGAFAFEITGASVQPVAAPVPSTITGPPAHVVTFLGLPGARPDPAVWRYETGGNGWGNGEVQTYADSVDNARLDGLGHLEITARQETATGPDGIERRFTSARLNSDGKLTVAAGSYVEAPIVAPIGAGVWPAFWLAGADFDHVGWPAAGELDVLEGWGARPTIAHSAIHLGTRADPHAHRQYGWGEPGGTTDLGEPLDARTHLYGVYFDAQVVRFYIDRKPTMTVWADDAIAAGDLWPFDRPQHMILNVAVPGGNHSEFPKTMRVGPISVWAGGIPFS